jgi:hypothetical protein
MITDSSSRIGVYDRGMKRLGYHKVEGQFGSLYLYSNEQEVKEEATPEAVEKINTLFKEKK